MKHYFIYYALFACTLLHGNVLRTAEPERKESERKSIAARASESGDTILVFSPYDKLYDELKKTMDAYYQPWDDDTRITIAKNLATAYQDRTITYNSLEPKGLRTYLPHKLQSSCGAFVPYIEQGLYSALLAVAQFTSPPRQEDGIRRGKRRARSR